MVLDEYSVIPIFEITSHTEVGSLIIYADLVFLLNGLIDFLLLWLTSGIRRQKVPFWRLVVAAIVGGLYTMCYLWTTMAPLFTLSIKLLVSFIMMLIAFGYSHPLAFLRNLGVFYLTCVICGGALVALHYLFSENAQLTSGVILTQSSVSWVLIICSFPLIWLYTNIVFRTLHEQAEIHSFLTPVCIHTTDRKIECIGLVDTGNQLRDPISRIPVMIVEVDQLQEHIPQIVIDLIGDEQWQEKMTQLPLEWMVRLRVIPYRVTGREGEMMLAFRPDRVEVWKENNWHNAGQVIIGIDVGRLSTDGTYQAILHPSCITLVG